MPVLDPSEYDASYFDGRFQTLKHNAGYGKYARWYRSEGANSLGEYWADYAAGWINALALQGRKVLEIGCAKGFLVEYMADAGVDVYGIDVSDWCINSCDGMDIGDGNRTDPAAVIRRPDLASRFFLGDVTAGALAQFANNEFDHVISFRVIECFDDADLPALVSELNRICKTAGPRGQVHVTDNFTGEKAGAGAFYNQRTIQQWVDDFAWDNGTIFAAYENTANRVTK